VYEGSGFLVLAARLASCCNLHDPCASTSKNKKNRLRCPVSLFPSQNSHGIHWVGGSR
jgi:hypothetical protein